MVSVSGNRGAVVVHYEDKINRDITDKEEQSDFKAK